MTEFSGNRDSPSDPLPPVEAVLVKPIATKNPSGLTTICVISLTLGGMGLLAAMGQMLNVGMGGNLQNAWSNVGTAGMSAGMREAQTRMMTAMHALVSRYSAVNFALATLHGLLGAAMLYGASQSMKLRRRGRNVLFWTLCLAVPFEIGRFIPATMIQLDMASVIEEYMSGMFPKGGNPARFGGAAAKVGVFIGIGVSVVWGLAKTVFYVVGARYLSRSEIRSLFLNTKAG